MKFRAAGLIGGLISMFFMLFCLGWAYQRGKMSGDRSEAIVILEEVSLFKSPENKIDVHFQSA